MIFSALKETEISRRTVIPILTALSVGIQRAMREVNTSMARGTNRVITQKEPILWMLRTTSRVL